MSVQMWTEVWWELEDARSELADRIYNSTYGHPNEIEVELLVSDEELILLEEISFELGISQWTRVG